MLAVKTGGRVLRDFAACLFINQLVARKLSWQAIARILLPARRFGDKTVNAGFGAGFALVSSGFPGFFEHTGTH
jgi:hypothetical protein